jgi:hypothetical protein
MGPGREGLKIQDFKAEQTLDYIDIKELNDITTEGDIVKIKGRLQKLNQKYTKEVVKKYISKEMLDPEIIKIFLQSFLEKEDRSYILKKCIDFFELVINLYGCRIKIKSLPLLQDILASISFIDFKRLIFYYDKGNVVFPSRVQDKKILIKHLEIDQFIYMLTISNNQLEIIEETKKLFISSVYKKKFTLENTLDHITLLERIIFLLQAKLMNVASPSEVERNEFILSIKSAYISYLQVIRQNFEGKSLIEVEQLYNKRIIILLFCLDAKIEAPLSGYFLQERQRAQDKMLLGMDFIQASREIYDSLLQVPYVFPIQSISQDLNKYVDFKDYNILLNMLEAINQLKDLRLISRDGINCFGNILSKDIQMVVCSFYSTAFSMLDSQFRGNVYDIISNKEALGTNSDAIYFFKGLEVMLNKILKNTCFDSVKPMQLD